jgi:2-polyprenyl-3-methyl-5-hydroxy-6-metoxy-1,4-benzoquinol methylase
MAERKAHWENIYTVKAPAEVSWYQPHPETSLELITRTGIEKAAQIIDVGGGASTLVDDLLSQGYSNITVLDIASAALEKSQARLGTRATSVTWVEADITQASLPPAHYDLWHDRAVFHFLTEAKDRLSYTRAVEKSLKPGGHLIVATFAADGPKKCSGLDIVRYSPDELRGQFGDHFRLIESLDEAHQTPFGSEQRFIYCHFQKT